MPFTNIAVSFCFIVQGGDGMFGANIPKAYPSVTASPPGGEAENDSPPEHFARISKIPNP